MWVAVESGLQDASILAYFKEIFQALVCLDSGGFYSKYCLAQGSVNGCTIGEPIERVNYKLLRFSVGV